MLIAVVAYNYNLSCEAIRVLAENDLDSKPKIIRKNEIIMEDGTRYKTFSEYSHVRGYCIDQLILVDDSRWEVDINQWELINWVKYSIIHSCVPEEFKIQKYEW